MNDNMKAWVAALRSGKYRQTGGQLTVCHTDGTMSHCCLGVACELAAAAGATVPTNDGLDRAPRGVPSRSYDGEFSLLPYLVQKWLGVDEADPMLKTDLDRRHASILNDGLGYNFNEIADAIERTFGAANNTHED